MREYTFYGDESFHTRNITNKNNSVNIYGENENDCFIYTFAGIESNKTSNLLDAFNKIEEELKQLLEIKADKELKGLSFKRKNFTYGIATFDKNALDFYDKFFRLLIKNKVLFQVTMCSKTEILIEKCLKGIAFRGLNIEAFVYTLIKFLYSYRCIPVMTEFFEHEDVTSNSLISKIKELLKNVINKTEGLKRKQKETDMLRQLLYVLENAELDFETDIKYGWDYDLIFEGLDNFLSEMKITKECIRLFLDKEDNIYKKAKEHLYPYVVSEDSAENLGIRIADIFSNFIGRISYAIQEDLKEPECKAVDKIIREDYSAKNLLNKKWFDISEQQFNLYKIIAKYFSLQEKIYWSTYSGIFIDNSKTFFSVFQYIDIYTDYDDFKCINSYMHTERFNVFVCTAFQEYFNRMESKH